jgi:hypothetical protein
VTTYTNFCTIWKLNCGRNLSNATLIFINLPDIALGSLEGRDVRRALSALLPFVSLRIYVMDPGLSPSLNWTSLTDSTGFNFTTIQQDVKRGLVVVCPEPVAGGLANGSRGRDFVKSILTQEKVYTDSLRRSMGNLRVPAGDLSAAFLAPDPRRWRSAYMNFVQRMAEFIADVVRRTPDLLPDNIVPMLKQGLEWQGPEGNRSDHGVEVNALLIFRAERQLEQIRKLMVQQHAEWITEGSAAEIFVHRPETLDMDSAAKIDAVVMRVGNEFLEKARGVTPDLPEWVTVELLAREGARLREDLTREIPLAVTRLRARLISEYQAMCADVIAHILDDVTNPWHAWRFWFWDVKAASLVRFSIDMGLDGMLDAQRLLLEDEYYRGRRRLALALTRVASAHLGSLIGSSLAFLFRGPKSLVSMFTIVASVVKVISWLPVGWGQPIVSVVVGLAAGASVLCGLLYLWSTGLLCLITPLVAIIVIVWFPWQNWSLYVLLLVSVFTVL